MNQLIVKTFIAGGAIGHRRAVKFGAADGVVLQGAAAGDALIGISDCPGGVVADERVDVVLLGWTAGEIGGVVARGAFLTSDANGKLVAAAPAVGANAGVLGRAFVSAVDGDIVDGLVNPGQIQG